jgi:hypothetical protein
MPQINRDKRLTSGTHSCVRLTSETLTREIREKGALRPE